MVVVQPLFSLSAFLKANYTQRAAKLPPKPSSQWTERNAAISQAHSSQAAVYSHFHSLTGSLQRGDEVTWYADGDKIVRNEYNPATAYAFDRVFQQHANSQEVYEVAAKPVVKAAMEGVNGTVFAYGVTQVVERHTLCIKAPFVSCAEKVIMTNVYTLSLIPH